MYYRVAKYEDLRISSQGQTTPLHFAAIQNSPAIVRLLLQHGANVHDEDDVLF